MTVLCDFKYCGYCTDVNGTFLCARGVVQINAHGVCDYAGKRISTTKPISDECKEIPKILNIAKKEETEEKKEETEKEEEKGKESLIVGTSFNFMNPPEVPSEEENSEQENSEPSKSKPKAKKRGRPKKSQTKS